MLKQPPEKAVQDERMRRSAPGGVERACNAVLVFGVPVLLAFGVLAFGAVETWAIFCLEAGAAVLMGVWFVREAAAGALRITTHPLYLPAVAFFLLIVAQVVLHVSAYPYTTGYEAAQYLAYGIILFLGAECYRIEGSARKFLFTLVTFGSLYAAFAIAQSLAPNGKLYWIRTPRFGGWIFGSYVDHSHYAGLMEMLAPLAIVLACSELLGGAKRVLVAFAATIMAASIFLSASRGGMLAFIVQMAVFALLVGGERGRRRNTVLLLGSVVLGIVALVAFASSGQVFARVGDVSVPTRAAILRDSGHMWLQRPVLGWGLGTFPVVYPHFRSLFSTSFLNAAHNDWVQVLVEMGALGMLLMLWFVVQLFRYGRPHTPLWRFEWRRAARLGALVGCTGILVHGFVDFNLQIPANAAIFFFLAGIAAQPKTWPHGEPMDM